jgi:phage terminase large subunit GpA-like protein
MLTTIPKRTIRKALRRLKAARNQALKPPPNLSLPQWADKYRRLSTSSGAIGGPWRTSRVEVARGPMMAVKERGVKTITVMSCTQLMKTSLLENVIGYYTHLDPCPMLLTQPKEGAVKSFSKERLVPMSKATPVLRDLLGESKARSSDDTLQYKEFPGGFLAMESAGSPTNLAMRAIRVTLLDEIDKYETTKEGDPVLLAEERTSTFDKINSLHIRTCSPTWEETSRIYKSYQESDQRRAFVNCPHCQYSQTLDFFRHVNWNKSEEGEHFPFTAAIYCENCGTEWSESERIKIMTTEGAIRWRQTRPFTCCEVKQEPLKTRKWKWDSRYQIGYACCVACSKRAVPNTHAGYQAGKPYSPFITIPELADKWILNKDDPETKQTFYNTQLGLPFQAAALKKVEANVLLARREIYSAQVPMGGVVLTTGIDVQSVSKYNDGRLECEVVAWGRGEESWSIDYKVFIGDPAKPALWKELDDYLQTPFTHESGQLMAIRAACIDSGGHNTEEVYQFARARIGRNIWAIKGASDKSGQWSPVWPIPKLDPQKTRRSGYRPQMLGVNAAKESIRQKLLVEEPGPGFVHFPHDRAEAWFDQLMSENLILEKKAGVSTRKWVLRKGHANEALDARVYAYAALAGLRAVRKFNLDRAAATVEGFVAGPVAEELKAEVSEVEEVAVPQPQSAPVASPPRFRQPRRSSFVG